MGFVSSDLLDLIQRRFQTLRDQYLELIHQQKQADDELTKIAERLGLFAKLLELEGQKVKLPEEIESGPRRRRRKAA
jgi:hypothetical protein